MKSLTLSLGLVLLLGVSSTAHAQLLNGYKKDVPTGSSYCDNVDLGTYFYCEDPEPVEEEIEEEAAPAPPPPPPAPTEDPRITELNEYKAEFDRVMQVAIWEPTPENVYNYLSLQVEMLDKVQDFSGQFEKTVWQNPELNYGVEQPLNTKGVTHYRAETSQSYKRNLSKVKDRYGFYYFYAGNCGACTVFTPIMKTFANYHDISVLAVSMDGEPNYHFDDWQVDNGIAKGLGLDKTITPAVVMLDTETGETVSVSFGVVTVRDLERRIFKLTDGKRKTYTREF